MKYKFLKIFVFLFLILSFVFADKAFAATIGGSPSVKSSSLSSTSFVAGSIATITATADVELSLDALIQDNGCLMQGDTVVALNLGTPGWKLMSGVSLVSSGTPSIVNIPPYAVDGMCQNSPAASSAVPESDRYSFSINVGSLSAGTYNVNVTGHEINWKDAVDKPFELNIGSFTVTAPVSNYTVSATAGAGGSIVNTPSDPNPKTSITAGSTTSFTATPSSGYTVDSNVVSSAPTNCIPGGFSANTYTTGTINANCTYTFSFSRLPMSGTLTPASSTCTIAAGASTCVSPMLTWTTTNPVGTSAVTSATATPSPANGNSGSSTFTIPYNGGSPSYLTLYNNAVQLAQASVTPSCAVNTTWDAVSGTCKTNPAPVNGMCGAYHYLCSSGTSSNNVAGGSAWTWTCLGSNGGTNASCSETIYPCGNGANNPNTCNTCTAPLIWNGSSCVSPTSAPTVTTKSPVTSIAQNTATGGGNTTSNGGSTVTQAGLVWGTMLNPTTFFNSGMTYDGWAIGGPWTSNITGLTANTTYHVRAYATNSVGTSYGADVSFTTIATPATGSISASGCTIPAGSSSCSGSIIYWNTVNPQGTSNITSDTPAPNTLITTGNSGTNFAVNVPFPSRKFFLNNNSLTIAGPATAYANCASGTGWDSVSGKCKSGATTCANGAVNYPACTVDANGKCLNGAYNPVTCNAYSCSSGYVFDGTSCVLSGGTTNGTCAKTHYSCTTGTSGSNVNTPSAWNWSCNGTGGGSSASCTELKKKPKFLEN